MHVDSDAGDQPPDWVATRPGSPCLVVSHASPSDTASFFDNHTARSRHSEAFWKAVIQHRRSLTIRENSRTHISRRGRGQACTSVRFWECGWEDLRDGCAAFLVFRVGSARTMRGKGALPRVGARRRTPHRGGTHTMKVPPLSERPITEEEEQAFLAPPSRRKKRSIVDTRAALRPWVIGIGLTVLVAVASVAAYRLGAGIGSWNENPSATATPTVHPAPASTVSSEPAMSGGYEIGPDGVLVRPAQYAADTYTKPELPEEAKENSERGAEAAAEHYLALLIYSWNTGDTQPLANMSDPSSNFAKNHIANTQEMYTNGWSFGNSVTVQEVLRLEAVSSQDGTIPSNTVGVRFRVSANNGTRCKGQSIIVDDSEHSSTITLFMTWKDNRWTEVQGSATDHDDE